MIETVRAKGLEAGAANVRAEVRDFVASGTGLPGHSIDATLLFNILRHEEPLALIGEAWRILRREGSWRSFTGTTIRSPPADRLWTSALALSSASPGEWPPASLSIPGNDLTCALTITGCCFGNLKRCDAVTLVSWRKSCPRRSFLDGLRRGEVPDPLPGLGFPLGSARHWRQ